MTKLNKTITILMAFLFVFCASFTWTHAATINAASVSYSDVSSAVSAANSGDTVVVPAGTATWNTTLTITKGINLIGAGVGNTIISSTSSNYIIRWVPATPASDESFRLSGFTFDLNSASAALNLVNTSATPSTQVRIDNNYFKDSIVRPPMFELKGVYGVVDNNTFDGSPHLDNYGANATSWSNLTFDYGSANCLYYEDNTFIKDDAVTSYAFFSGGVGGSYCIRYNTWNTNVNLQPAWDVHGNMGGGGNHSTMGFEAYGNLIYANGINVLKLIHHRGGRGLAFFNYVDNGVGYIQTVEEHCDSLNPPVTAPDGSTQHVNDAYYWNNRADNAIGPPFGYIIAHVNNQSRILQNCPSDAIAENVDYWDYWDYVNSPTFTGETGVGCGTLATMQAIGTCTEGVGFWATNQSCDIVSTDHIGVNPTTPLSGTLYRCNDSNTWVAHFTPYTYPHPLRNGAVKNDAVMKTPQPPENLRIVNP